MDSLVIDGFSISTIYTIVSAIFGGIAIMLYVSTKTLRDSRDDLEHRVGFLEEEGARDKIEIADLKLARDFWRSEAKGDERLDHLVDLVVSLSALLTEHHGETQKNWIAVRTVLGHVGTALDKITESFDELATRLAGAGALQTDDRDDDEKRRP